jgi:hypothetical protein
MNKKLGPILLKVFFSLICGGALFAPAAGRAQTYWLHYGMTIGSTDSGTQNNSYDSGKVQSMSLVTTNLSGPGSVASASATPSASFGLLQLTANCSVDDPGWNGNGHISRFEANVGGGPDVEFQDWLTITSTTLPAGTPVRIQIVCETAGYITPGTGSGLKNTTSSASVDLRVEKPSGVVTATAAIGGGLETNILSEVVTNIVGSRFYFNSHIFAQGWAEDNASPGFSGSVSTTITAQTYVNVLTPGASYVADSGTIYPTLQLPPPALNIQSAGGLVVISWSADYANYVLEQNSDLANSNGWTASGYSITTFNDINSITLTPPPGNLFFRLAQ